MESYTFLLIVVWYFLITSKAYPSSHPNWKYSRYIIDNRKKSLFNKPFIEIYSRAIEVEPICSNTSVIFTQNSSVVPLNAKDFKMKKFGSQSAFKSYNSDFLRSNSWAKLGHFWKDGYVDHYKSQYGEQAKNIFKNSVGSVGSVGLENLKFSKDLKNLESENLNDFLHQIKKNYESMIGVIKQNNENKIILNSQKTLFAANEPSTIVEKEQKPKNASRESNSTINLPELSRSKTKNLMANTSSSLWKNNLERSQANEKRVYETRIETVSYHQEIILNRPRPLKNSSGTTWRQKKTQENQEKSIKNSNFNEINYDYNCSRKNHKKIKNSQHESNFNDGESRKAVEMVRSTSKPDNRGSNNLKFGYVLEEKNHRKYRVEKRTADGFIVGEYGIVSHDDGSLRGVRYTADSKTNPKIIYQALMKFLSL